MLPQLELFSVNLVVHGLPLISSQLAEFLNRNVFIHDQLPCSNFFHPIQQASCHDFFHPWRAFLVCFLKVLLAYVLVQRK